MPRKYVIKKPMGKSFGNNYSANDVNLWILSDVLKVIPWDCNQCRNHLMRFHDMPKNMTLNQMVKELGFEKVEYTKWLIEIIKREVELENV